MREIKFRAWSKRFNKMFYYLNKAQDDQDVCNIFSHFDDEYEFMQYTGLKDKNGVEIYEGDVVVYYHSPTRLIPVSSIDPMKQVYKDEESGETMQYRKTSKIMKVKGNVTFSFLSGMELNLRGRYHWWECEEDGLLTLVEVKGNLYQNPELIK